MPCSHWSPIAHQAWLCAGVPELRAALQEKIERENGLHGVSTDLQALNTSLAAPRISAWCTSCLIGLAKHVTMMQQHLTQHQHCAQDIWHSVRANSCLVCMQYNVMVTAGANQALSSCMLTLVDPEDAVVLFKPYCAPQHAVHKL